MADVNELLRTVQRRSEEKLNKEKAASSNFLNDEEIQTGNDDILLTDEQRIVSTESVEMTEMIDGDTSVELVTEKSSSNAINESGDKEIDTLMTHDALLDEHTKIMKDQAKSNKSQEIRDLIKNQSLLQNNVKISFGNIFVESAGPGSKLVYNPKYATSYVKNVSTDILDQVVIDLKKQCLQQQVSIGVNSYEILDSNKVFTQRSTTMRYLSFMGLQNVEMRLQLARQFYLEVYPNGEVDLLHGVELKNDVFDIYVMLLASATTNNVNTVDALLLLEDRVRNMESQIHLTRKENSRNFVKVRNLGYAILYGVSWLLSNRLGINSVPNIGDESLVAQSLSDKSVQKLIMMLKNVFGENFRKAEDTTSRNNKKKNGFK